MGKYIPRNFAVLVILCSVALLLFLSPMLLGQVEEQYREKIDKLRETLVSKGFNSEELDRIFSDERVKVYPEIVGRKGKGINYMSKRFGLLTRHSIQKGKRILEEQWQILEEVEKTYGVRKEIIVAIMRIETNFGKYQGSSPVFNSLLTFAVVENRRSEWAKEELFHLLAICKERGKDPFSIHGSWAGAFGLAQFIPSSYVKFAVDGDGNGEIDLFVFADAAASIANYLKENGWDKDRGNKKRKAVWSYNHCKNYVNAVFTYANAI